MKKEPTSSRLSWAENPKTETLVIRVEPALKRHIERLATKAGRPMASFARELLRQGVERMTVTTKGRKP